MNNYSKESVKLLIDGGSIIGYMVMRTGKDAVGEVVGTCADLKSAREIQKASKAKTIIVKASAKMVK